jgi:DNA-binding beta-propeller fold protein YncE
VFVSDTFNHRIQELSPHGLPLSQWGTRGGLAGQFRRPEGLAIDTNGGIVVVDADNDRLQRYTPGPTL